MTKKNNSTSNYQYNNNEDYRKSVFPLYYYNNVFFRNIGLLSNAFTKMLSNSIEFNAELLNTFAQAYNMYLGTISEYDKSWKDYTQLDKILRSRSHKIFDAKFREERFVNPLSDT